MPPKGELNKVKVGDYIIVQAENHAELHKVTLNGVLKLGKDQIELGSILGRPAWTTYRLVRKMHNRHVFNLKECTVTEALAEQLKKNVSVEADSKTVRKVAYITIRYPTLRLLSEIMYRTAPGKIMGIRMDTLSQIIVNAGVQSHGTYMLYESGSQGLVGAAMLNSISGTGHLILVHPAKEPQMQAILAMNYNKSDQMSSCLISVNVHGLLRKLQESEEEMEQSKGNDINNEISSLEVTKEEETKDPFDEISRAEDVEDRKDEARDQMNEVNSMKRKLTVTDESIAKKPRLGPDIEKAADILMSCKADCLVIIARHHPETVLTALLPYVAYSRPFVVFCQCREPLVDMYLKLKEKNNTVGLRITETWLRSHQILNNETRPDKMMSGGGGFLLTGITVEPGTSPIEQQSTSS